MLCFSRYIGIIAFGNSDLIIEIFVDVVFNKRILWCFNFIISRKMNFLIKTPTHHPSNSGLIGFIYFIIIINAIGFFYKKNTFQIINSISWIRCIPNQRSTTRICCPRRNIVFHCNNIYSIQIFLIEGSCISSSIWEITSFIINNRNKTLAILANFISTNTIPKPLHAFHFSSNSKW